MFQSPWRKRPGQGFANTECYVPVSSYGYQFDIELEVLYILTEPPSDSEPSGSRMRKKLRPVKNLREPVAIRQDGARASLVPPGRHAELNITGGPVTDPPCPSVRSSAPRF
jgi:hypothetical protein